MRIHQDKDQRTRNKAMTMPGRTIRIIIFALIGIAIGLVIVNTQAPQDAATILKPPTLSPETGAVPMAGIDMGGPFSLSDHTGKAVTEKDYEGRYKLIYFGFTFCPAICPTELQKITQTMNTLPPDLAAKITPLFITLDPERDTVDVMSKYVALFDPRLIGLTGTTAQIDDIKKNYRIFASKVQDEGMSDYTIDHSTFIYLMSQDNKALSIYRLEDTPDYMAQDIISKIQ